ncbi:MAG: hypothetical protein FWE76_08540, partial [Symbiobacteriaceae bacterium]|nr:hypothetical protein [Symbiobacteriaceae bacterium]
WVDDEWITSPSTPGENPQAPGSTAGYSSTGSWSFSAGQYCDPIFVSSGSTIMLATGVIDYSNKDLIYEAEASLYIPDGVSMFRRYVHDPLEATGPARARGAWLGDYSDRARVFVRPQVSVMTWRYHALDGVLESIDGPLTTSNPWFYGLSGFGWNSQRTDGSVDDSWEVWDSSGSGDIRIMLRLDQWVLQNLNESYPNSYTRIDTDNNEHYHMMGSVTTGLMGETSIYYSGAYLTRRVFSGNFNAEVHSADEDFLTPADIQRHGLLPQLSLVPRRSGLAESGIYVGSTVQVALPKSHYSPLLDGDTSVSIYLTRKGEDDILARGVLQPGSPTAPNHIFYLDLVWTRVTEYDLTEDYTIHVVLNRKQDVVVNFRGSRASELDEPDIAAFLLGDGYSTDITYGYFEPVLSGGTVTFTEKTGSVARSALISDASQLNADLEKMLANFVNLKWINFGLDPTDVIILPGVIFPYPGNARIPITREAIQNPILLFTWIAGPYKGIPLPMEVRVSRMELYFDGNDDGKIDGNFDPVDNLFTLDPGGSDLLVGRVAAGDIEITWLSPALVESLDPSNYHQLILKVYYNMLPRSFEPIPSARDSKAEILPAFLTTVTSSQLLGRMSDEQKAMRYIDTGVTGKDKDIYGVAAMANSFIDVPLGGDLHPPQLNAAKTEYLWNNREWQGSLLPEFTFSKPWPIFLEKTVIGDEIPVVPAGFAGAGIGADGSYNPPDFVIDMLNGFLGSLGENDGFNVSIREVREDKTPLLIEYTSRPIISTFPSVLAYLNLDGQGELNASGDAGASGNSMDEYNMDVGITLPNIEMKVSDYFSIAIDDKEIGITVGIPIFSYDSSKKKADGNNDLAKDSIKQGAGMQGSKDQDANTLNKMNEVLKNLGSNNQSDEAKSINRDLKKAAKGKDGMGISSKKMTASVAISINIILEYSPLDSAFKFSKLMVLVA